jgi:hypothetical protein
LDPLRNGAGVPNYILCYVRLKYKQEDGKFYLKDGFATWKEPLYQENQPLWYVHSNGQLNCDIAVLPLNVPNTGDIMTTPFIVSPYDGYNPEMAMEVGGNLFILGYMFGMEPFPTWKRATVASEPFLSDGGQIPFLSVDTAARQGLSGSPVYIYNDSTYRTETGGIIMATGVHHRFVGIYTGRRPVNSGTDAQIGIVWPSKLVEEILLNGVKDRPWEELTKVEFPRWKYPSIKPSDF